MMKKIKYLANESQSKPNLKKIEEDIKKKFDDIFQLMNFDPESDHNLRGTSKRVAKMYVHEIFKGCFHDEPPLTLFPNTKKCNQLVITGPITLRSMCSHHLMPIHGKVWIGYIPGDNVVGLSKFTRIVDHFARRPQIQEELTQQLLDYFSERLKPSGLVVLIKANHMCMTHRGVNESHENEMITSALYGILKESSAARKEFFDMIGINK